MQATCAHVSHVLQNKDDLRMRTMIGRLPFQTCREWSLPLAFPFNPLLLSLSLSLSLCHSRFYFFFPSACSLAQKVGVSRFLVPNTSRLARLQSMDAEDRTLSSPCSSAVGSHTQQDTRISWASPHLGAPIHLFDAVNEKKTTIRKLGDYFH